MGQHFFDVDIATEYGVNCAILFHYIGFWVEKNEANEKHFHDGRYWTYNSVKAFEKLFPYLSSKQISSTLKKLEEYELIMCGNYNKLAYDRTKWYALTEKGNRLYKRDISILPNGKMEMPKKENGIDEKGEPIPYINTDIKTPYIKTDIKENTKRKETIPYQQIVDMYNDTCVSLPSVKSLSDKRKKAIKARLNTYTIDDFKTVFEKTERSDFLTGRTGQWSATFDWLLNENNMIKVLEGNYDNKAVKGKVDDNKAEEEAKKQAEEELERKRMEKMRELVAKGII